MPGGSPEALVEELAALSAGPLHRFADWPNADVPTVAFGVYTVWLPDGRLLYVGMSGRGMSADPLDTRRRGLWTRLDAHASGRRSGDQFCVYVCDRLVVPDLDTKQLDALREGALSLDALTKAYVRDNLAYRFVVLSDSATAYAVERHVQSGALDAGKPVLNPR